MQQICAVSGKIFEITKSDEEFYKKMGIPPPKLCPEERQRRRLVWQNMHHLYRRTCDATGKKIISNYAKNSNIKVFENSFWWSDNFDAKEFGKDFNFTRPFFEQFSELIQKVPHPNLNTDYLFDENSDFCNFAGIQKNCYLVFHATSNEDCLFGTGIKKCRNVSDCFNAFESELLYECTDCIKCYDVKFSQNCQNCSESWFLANCVGCNYCFGCTNLRQKEYHLFNKKVGKSEFEAFIKNFGSGKYSRIQAETLKFIKFLGVQIHPHFHGRHNENVLGDHILNSKKLP